MDNERDWLDTTDEETEAMLDAIQDEIMKDEMKTAIIDPVRLQHMRFV